MATQIGPDEKILILADLDAGMGPRDIAKKYGRHEQSIYSLVKRYHPSTILATRLLRANAEKLAERVIKHATVEEAIDVLSRPNMEVLRPIAKESVATGFFTSVSLDSLGSVREIKTGMIHATSDPAAQADRQDGNGYPQLGQAQPGQPAGYEPRGGRSGDGGSARRRLPVYSGPDEPADLPAKDQDLVVGPPDGYTPDDTDARARPKKRSAKVLANPAKQVVDSHPSRKAIIKLAKGRNTKDKDSSIHLRYDI